MSASNLTTDVALGAIYAQKLHLKFAAVSADIHSTWAHPEQTEQRHGKSLLWPDSPHER
jgi:hypothetical protein